MKELLQHIQESISGKNAPVSCVFANPVRMRSLNRRYRGKTYTPNVLTFRLAKNEGDIFICKEIAAGEARRLGIPTRERIAYLFIHGLLHLKGHTHSRTMERLEREYVKKFLLRY